MFLLRRSRCFLHLFFLYLGQKADKHVSPSAAHPQRSTAVFDQKSWKPQIVPYVHHKWRTATNYEFDLVNAQHMDFKFYQTFSYAVCCLPRRYPSRMHCKSCRTMITQSFLCERPSAVTQNDPAIESDFRASCDRMLDQIRNRTYSLPWRLVYSMLQALHKDELEQVAPVPNTRNGQKQKHGGVVQ